MIAQRFPGNLYYLTDRLPPKFGYIKKIAAALNHAGKLSKSGRSYTNQIVQNVVRGMHTDVNVKAEAERLVESYEKDAEKQARQRVKIEQRRSKRDLIVPV